MTGSVTGIRRRRTVAGRRETPHLPPDRDFYGQTLHISGSCESFFPGTASRAGRVLEAVLGSAFLYLQQHPELQPEPNRFAQRSWKSLNMQGGKA